MDEIFKNINERLRNTKRAANKQIIHRDQIQKDKLDMRLFEAYDQIANNTVLISEMISLIKVEDENLEVFDLIIEILNISKSETKEEAENKYRIVMKKLANLSGDVKVITKLMGYATTVWHSVNKRT